MTDYEAMIAYKRGDQEAFELLFKRYREVVRGWCFRHLQNNDDADDVSQTVWLDLAQYLKHAETKDYFTEEMKKGRFKNLAYRVSKNRSLDYIRNSDKDNTVYMSNLSELQIESNHSSETDLMINDLLKTLDLRDQVLIQLKIEGYTDEELAEKYDRPLNTMKSDIFRIREKLRESVPERGKII